MSEIQNSYSKYIRIGIFIICLIAIIFFIVKYAGAFKNAILVMLGFGAVVLVHEFGHFIVAKISNIKVEAFSIFMPPVLFGIQRTEKGFKFRILPEVFPKKGDETGEGALSFTIPKKCKPGETEYRIGLIPFGGFVKMLGQDDVGAIKASNDPRSFANKSVYVRASVIAAGVCFNVISAVIIFMIAFLHGINLPPAEVGGVMPDSPAAIAGIKPGDKIIEIGGKSRNLEFTNILEAAALSGRDQEIPVKVKHPNGEIQEYQLKAELMPGQQVRLFGILPPSSLTIAKLPSEDANSLYAKTGLRPGDTIKAVNGREVRGNWELMDIIQNSFTPNVTLTAVQPEKDGETKTIESKINLEWVSAFDDDFSNDNSLCNIYSMVPRLKVIGLTKELQDYFKNAGLSSDSNDTAALKEGDVILAIDDVNNPTRKDMNDIATKYESREVPIRVLRTETDGRQTIHNVTVVPKRSEDSNAVLIGIAIALDAENAVVADTITTENGYEKLEIPRGASITAIDGTKVSSFYDIIREIKKYPGQRITLDWRVSEEMAGNAAIDVSEDANKYINVQPILTEDIPFRELRELYKADGPIQAISIGYSKTISFITQTYLTLRRLFTGLVSPKNLMGPVGIIRASYEIVAERPLIVYVYFLGLINAVIAVFNFLPVPPLDGGLVLLLVIEKIKGTPISEKTQTIIAYITWVLILALIVYVTFNDLTRKM